MGEGDEPWYFPAASFRLAFAHSRRAGFRRGPHSRAGIARTNARLERIEGILVESGRSRTGNAASLGARLADDFELFHRPRFPRLIGRLPSRVVSIFNRRREAP